VEKVHEVGAWRGVSQVSRINMWEACYPVGSGFLEQGGALQHENWGQGWGTLRSGGAPSTYGRWGRVGRFALSFVMTTRTKWGARGIHMVFL